MTTIISPLVGSYHRPPAKTVLDHLPSGSALILQPEPENAYDPSAIAVLVSLDQIPVSQLGALEEELPLCGFALGELYEMGSGELHIGYVAASGGKPLQKAQEANPDQSLVGNKEVLALLAASPSHSASLAFDLNGRPLVVVAEGGLE